MARSKEVAAYRCARAFARAVAGWSYDAITWKLGYPRQRRGVQGDVESINR